MMKQNLEKALRLSRALDDWDGFEKALKKKQPRGHDSGLSMDAGYIEDDHGELVQPDHGIVLDADTARLVLAAAKPIIEAELKKLGVDGPTADGR